MKFLGIVLLLVIIRYEIHAQRTGIELNYHAGYNVPIHPRYPSIQAPTHGVEIALLKRAKKERLWAQLYKHPQIAYTLGFQSLGNDEVLGQAVYLVPSLNFSVFRAGAFEGQFRLGWGVAYMTKSYHSILNPRNIVMGANVNACAIIRFLAHYHITTQWDIFLGLNVTHYSNGGFVKPNLGINAPALQVGIQYEWEADPHEKEAVSTSKKHINFNKQVRPFIRLMLGVTEVATSGGVKYPIYGFSLGVSKLLTPINKVRLGGNYLYNMAPRALIQHQGGRKLEHWNYARLSLVAGHELLFGHWGFLSNLGIYLNAHDFQRSLLTAELGFNFYSRNYLKHQKQQFWIGCHVRTYGGEADFVQVVLGFQW